jgi:hypothetical protein
MSMRAWKLGPVTTLMLFRPESITPVFTMKRSFLIRLARYGWVAKA